MHTNLPVLNWSDAGLSPRGGKNVGRGALLRPLWGRGLANPLQPLVRTPSKQEMWRGFGRLGHQRASLFSVVTRAPVENPKYFSEIPRQIGISGP